MKRSVGSPRRRLSTIGSASSGQLGVENVEDQGIRPVFEVRSEKSRGERIPHVLDTARILRARWIVEVERAAHDVPCRKDIDPSPRTEPVVADHRLDGCREGFTRLGGLLARDAEDEGGL